MKSSVRRVQTPRFFLLAALVAAPVAGVMAAPPCPDRELLQLSAGGNHSLLLRSDGVVMAWGHGAAGQLGTGFNTDRLTAGAMSGVSTATAIAAGGDFSLALLGDTTVVATGGNLYGQLGDATNNPSNIPVAVFKLETVTQIAAGRYHALALLADTTVVAWGRNDQGQLGDGSNSDSNFPVAVSGLSGVTAIAAGGGHSLALLDDGTVRAWGDNAEGQLGNAANSDSNVPVTVSSLSGVTAIAAGGLHSLAIASGAVKAWGDNQIGQLGDTTQTDSNVPVTASGLASIVKIAAGDFHSLALPSGANVKFYSWGWNNRGQLGRLSPCDTCFSATPAQAGSPSKVEEIAAGGDGSGGHGLLIRNARVEVFAWGYNGFGQLGTGTFDNESVATAASVSAEHLLLEVSDDVTLCEKTSTTIGENFLAGGTPPYSYSWSPITDLDDASAAAPTASPSATTVYTLTVTDSAGCEVSDSVTITVLAPVADAGGDVSVCSGLGSVIGGSPSGSGGTGVLTYAWSPTTGLSSANVANPTATPTATTTYTLTVTDESGCTGTDDITVTVNSNPTAAAGADKATCAGSSTAIGGSPTASSGTGPYTYSWSPTTDLSDATAANPTATPTATRTYTVTVTDSNGCVGTPDAMLLTRNALPVANAGADATICGGSSTTLGGSPSASGGTGPYTYGWSPTTGLSSGAAANPTATPAANAVYSLTVTDSNGCVSVADAASITVNPSPDVDAGSDVEFCDHAGTTLGAVVTGGVGPFTYSWSPGLGLSSTTVAAPDANPAGSQTYTVTVTGSNACTGNDSVVVTSALSAATFQDVPVAHPFWGFVESVFGNDITGGCAVAPARYCPDDPITRGQMAVFLVRALNAPLDAGTTCFTDIAPPTASFVCKVAALGITAGCGNGKYCPDAPVSREQMAVFLLRAIGAVNDAGTSCFLDVSPQSIYAPFICELAQRGITGGCSIVSPIYCPTSTVTRGQMAVFVTRAFELGTVGICNGISEREEYTDDRRDLPSVVFPEGSVAATPAVESVTESAREYSSRVSRSAGSTVHGRRE